MSRVALHGKSQPPARWVFDGNSVLDGKGASALTKVNGPLIVKAVNHHDELVALAKLLVEEAEAFGFDSINVNCYGKAKAVLAKLEESK